MRRSNMQTQPEVKNERIKSYYNDILFSFGKLLRQLIYLAVRTRFDEYWEAVYENAVEQSKNKATDELYKEDFFFIAIRNHDKLLDETTEKLELNKLYRASLNWSEEERMGMLDEILLLKQIIYVQFVTNAYRKKYPLMMKTSDLINIADYCRDIRNAQSHFDKSDPQNILTVKRFNEFISNLKKLVSFCNNKKNKKLDESIRILYSEFSRICDDLVEKAGYPPINAEEFSLKNDVKKEHLLELCRINNVDYSVYENGKIYILSTPESHLIKLILDETMNKRLDKISDNYTLISEKFDKIAEIVGTTTNMQPLSELSDKIVQNNKIDGEYILPKLQYLKTYEMGFLNELQFEELCKYYNVFVDASAFLSTSSRRFITQTLIPAKLRFSKKACPVFMQRSARNEIYELATMSVDVALNNEKKTKLEAQKAAAKSALSRINELRSRGMLTIVGMPACDETSESMLLDFLEDYKERRFCVLTQEQFVADEIAKVNTNTFCAMKVAGSRPLIWSTTVNNLKADHNKYIKTIHNETKSKKGNTEKSGGNNKTNEITPAQATKQSVKKESQINQETELSNKTKIIQNIPYRLVIDESAIDDKTEYKIGDVLYDADKNEIVLNDFIAEGGEGAVFTLQNCEYVAKIYKPKRRTKKLKKKLNSMIENSIKSKNIAWPQYLLYNEKGHFVGFVMKRVPSNCMQIGHTALMINNNDVRERFIPDWTREDLVKNALAIIRLFRILHSKGIIMGDINPSNIMINPKNSNEVYFVDCDSYQIGDYLCTVGTPIFTSPDYYKRCNMKPDYSRVKRAIEDEYYAIATLVFEILMNGQAPFSSKSTEKSDIISDICNHKFAYRTKENTGADTPDGPYRMIWNNLHYDCKSKFASIFVENKVINDDQWINSLTRYLMEIQNGVYTKELFPKKYFDSNGSFKDFVCSCCGKEANMHNEQYSAIIERYPSNPILLCNDCKGFLNGVAYEIKANCEICGKGFYATYGDIWRKKEYGFRIKCSDCKNNRR